VQTAQILMGSTLHVCRLYHCPIPKAGAGVAAPVLDECCSHRYASVASMNTMIAAVSIQLRTCEVGWFSRCECRWRVGPPKCGWTVQLSRGAVMLSGQSRIGSTPSDTVPVSLVVQSVGVWTSVSHMHHLQSCVSLTSPVGGKNTLQYL
jgi:hypothetical protein